MRKGLCCGLLVLLAAIIQAAGLATPVSAQRTKGELVIGVAQFPPNMHPSIEPTTVKSYILGGARRPITATDVDRKLICMLCTELPTLANGGAKRTTLPSGEAAVEVTLKLQPQAKWGDGTPISSRDVVFSWEQGNRGELGFSNPDLFRRIRMAKAVDDKTVTLTLSPVQYDYNELDDLQVLPAHIEGPIFGQLADKAEYSKQSAYNREPTNPGLYHGPYVISEFQPGAYVVLSRNPHWWGRPPGFAKVTIRVIENTAALEQNLLSGDVDYIAGEGIGLSLDQVLALQRKAADRFDYIYQPALTYEHIDLKAENPLLADKRVRQALLHALDRETLSQRLFAGKQPVAHAWVPPLDPGYDPELRKFAFDPKRAAALLDAAGFRPGADGVRVDATGRRLSFEFATTAGNRVRELVQQVVQSQWKEVGIEVQIKNEPARTFFGETMRRRSFTGLAMYAWSSKPEAPPIVTLRSDNIPRPENNFSGSNYPGFANAEMDRLIEATVRELDPEQRKTLWKRMQDIYTEELPVLPLYFRADPFAIPKWLKGIRPTGTSFGTTLWLEEWHAG